MDKNTEKDVTRYDETATGYQWVADGHLKEKHQFVAWDNTVETCKVWSESLSGVANLTLYGIVSLAGNMVMNKVNSKYMYLWYKDDALPKLFASRDPKEVEDKSKQVYLSEVSVNNTDIHGALVASILVDLKHRFKDSILEKWGKNPFDIFKRGE